MPTAPPEPVEPSAGVGDSFYPLMGNGGYDVLHYDIDLDITPSANALDAVTTLTAVATGDLDTFNLDFHGLEVETVAVDGVEAEFSRDGSEMTVHLAAAISSGAQFTVAVAYSGIPQPVADPGVPFFPVGWHRTDGMVYTVSQPSGAMTWYPNNNHPTDKATFTFQITVPDSVTAAATGLLADETSADGQTTTTWHMDDPMATYLAAVYVGDFERHEQQTDSGLLIRDYIPRDSDPSILRDLAVAPNAIAFFEEILGPYPFDVYGTIVTPFPLGFALENQTLSIHDRYGIDPYIIAHEAAHQWMGNSATVDDWSQIWLHEGFAHYLGLLFVADFHGQNIESVMSGEYRDLVVTGASPPGGITVQQLFDPNAVYRRGALTLHALRTHTGDDVFFDILRTHYDQAAGGTTNTELFLGIVYDLADAEAVSLVESWLYDPEMPGIVSGPTL
ncbi:M1 family metallopeptidase [Candidatus Poriferisocius sp.]|uniref:M1 family metallopeptidase n=1 Tax=Candidatus Poriferisocius sp. TaxID=3101276 RepID=UPI003B029C19